MHHTLPKIIARPVEKGWQLLRQQIEVLSGFTVLWFDDITTGQAVMAMRSLLKAYTGHFDAHDHPGFTSIILKKTGSTYADASTLSIHLNVNESHRKIRTFLSSIPPEAECLKRAQEIKEVLDRKQITVSWAQKYTARDIMNTLEKVLDAAHQTDKDFSIITAIKIKDEFDYLPKKGVAYLKVRAPYEQVLTFLENTAAEASCDNMNDSIQEQLRYLQNKFEVLCTVENQIVKSIALEMATRTVKVLSALMPDLTKMVRMFKLALRTSTGQPVAYDPIKHVLEISTYASFRQVCDTLLDIFLGTSLTEPSIIISRPATHAAPVIPVLEYDHERTEREQVKARIRSAAEKNDPAKVLGIDPTDSTELRLRKYYGLLLMFHPDLFSIHHDTDREEITRLITNAWHELQAMQRTITRLQGRPRLERSRSRKLEISIQ